jgi:hypothetical protein
MNKKLLIAAGVGALVIVAQTAVSAAINPLERANETAAPVASESRVEVASARAFAVSETPARVSETPARIDSSALSAGNAPAPRTGEARVADRVAATPPSYNMALSAASRQSAITCYYKPDACKDDTSKSATTTLAATGVGIALIALVQDGGQSG